MFLELYHDTYMVVFEVLTKVNICMLDIYHHNTMLFFLYLPWYALNTVTYTRYHSIGFF